MRDKHVTKIPRKALWTGYREGGSRNINHTNLSLKVPLFLILPAAISSK